jgi:hydrogenase nickel incorporation protein HypA/HybF
VHELSITEAVVDQITERMNGAKVVRVRLEIGRLSGVVPDALRFCFDLVVAGTTVEGATLEIVEQSGRARCRRCEAEFELNDLLGFCPCGSPEWQVLTGEELHIKEVEVA